MTAARALTLEELRAELAAMEQRIDAKMRRQRRNLPPVPASTVERDEVRDVVLRKRARRAKVAR